jgi:hypothetical protein
VNPLPPEWQWQLIRNDWWVFGKKIRGAVRQYVAQVCRYDVGWEWYILGSGESGRTDAFAFAIEAAEQALGIKE